MLLDDIPTLFPAGSREFNQQPLTVFAFAEHLIEAVVLIQQLKAQV